MNESKGGRMLVSAGLVLFMAGLFSGVLIPHLKNARMGMAAHMEAVMNGMFLVIAGGILRDRLNINERVKRIIDCLLVYSGYANLVFLTLAAHWGTSRITPIAGNGFIAELWQEAVVSVGLVSVALTIFAGVAIAIFGLFRAPANNF